MMYVVNMACGLANRMFQYSYYLYLKKVGYDVSVDYYETGKLAHESVEWNQIFPKAYISQVSWREVLTSSLFAIYNAGEVYANSI